ncbi:MAG TPA: Gfo/Idh/MocA family oxidoreductase [bacterium]|nr:Gfo/Idh/MocA family oxidoreductase [bacterium]HPP08506.1 Gfo/Idh/MocA family oxidoreductase [bacterium]
MEKKIKVGIIGAGGRAHFQTKAIIETGIGEPVIVYSPFEEEARKFSEKFEIEYTSSLEDIFKNPELMATTISTPNTTHYLIAKKCLENNKHVLVEYPPTLNIQELDHLINIARNRNLVYWVSLTQILENPFYTIKKNINSIGQLIFSYYTYVSSFLGGWYADPELCGPLYAAQHFHFVSQLLELEHDAESVCAFENIKYSNDNKKMVSTSSIMVLKFPSGHIANIEFAMGIKNARDFKIKFVGENGILYFDGNKLNFETKETGKKELKTEESNSSIDTANFLKNVADRHMNIETAIKARKILKTCLCAEMSAKEKRIVKVEKSE